MTPEAACRESQNSWQIYCVLMGKMINRMTSVGLVGLAMLVGCSKVDGGSRQLAASDSAADTVAIPDSAASVIDSASRGTGTRTTVSGGTVDRVPRAAAANVPVSARDSALRARTVVRALYANRWASQSGRKMRHLIAIADSTEINAIVLDMKDEFGLNFRTTNADWAKTAGTAGVVPNLKALLDTMKAHGILPIARIVVFNDSVAARVHPEWTIRTADGSPWRLRGSAWVNPYKREAWDYNIGVAEELARIGFGEIQFDYIRFPEPYKSLPPQVFGDTKGVSKPDNLAAFLKEAKTRLNALGVRSTADIFGLVTTVKGPLEIGQWWEKVAPVTDALLPMVYPSHYPRGSFGIAYPNAEPYKVMRTALDTARVRNERLGIKTEEHVRPWIQAFTLGKPEYGPEQIRQQKQAIYDAGFDGWILWSPGSKYDAFVPALERELVTRKKKH